MKRKNLKKNAMLVVDQIISSNSHDIIQKSFQEEIITETIKKCFGQKVKKPESSMLAINVDGTTYEFWKNGNKILKIVSVVPGTKTAQKDETVEISKKQALSEITQLFIKAFCENETEVKAIFDK
jgi:hypothetical protein